MSVIAVTQSLVMHNTSLSSRKWLESEFESLVNLQRGTVASKTQRPTAISATNGIIAVLKALNGKTSPEEVLSLGILSTGTGQQTVKVVTV